MVDPFASFCRFIPVFFRLEVFRPPREGFALVRPCAVDKAFALFEKDAVVVRVMFLQRNSIFYSPRVFFYELLFRDAEELCHCSDFFLIDPHITWRSSTALTAACAFKIQSFFKPWLFGLFHEITRQNAIANLLPRGCLPALF